MAQATPTIDLSKVHIFLDVANLYFRNAHKLGNLRRSDGAPSGAFYGYVRMVDSLVKKYSRGEVVVCACLEGGGSALRKQEFPDYKGDRHENLKMDSMQHDAIKKWHIASGHVLAASPDGEADDVIAKCVRESSEEGITCIICSSDHDFRRLLSQDRKGFGDVLIDRIDKSGELYTESRLRKELGCAPDDYLKILALTGDSTDNVPGIRGVGEVTACKILAASNWSIAEALKHPKVVEHKDVVMRNLGLLDFIDCKVVANVQKPNRSAVIELYKEWEFKSMLPKEPSVKIDVFDEVARHNDIEALRKKLDTQKQELNEIHQAIVGSYKVPKF